MTSSIFFYCRNFSVLAGFTFAHQGFHCGINARPVQVSFDHGLNVLDSWVLQVGVVPLEDGGT
jgi:hypothetical protein